MAEEGAVIACHTEADWRQQLQLANESNKLVIYPSSPLLCFRSCYPSLFLMRIRCFLLKVSIFVFWNSVIFRSVSSDLWSFFSSFFCFNVFIIVVLVFRVLSQISSWFVVRCDANGKQDSEIVPQMLELWTTTIFYLFIYYF